MIKKKSLRIDLAVIENKLFRHLFRYQQWYFLLLISIILATSFVSNFLNDKPLIMGVESYYHLNLAQESIIKNLSYLPLYFLANLLDNTQLIIVPLLLSFGSLILYLQLAKKLEISSLFSIFFLIFLIFSPSFIFTYSTISAYSYFTFLTLASFLLLMQEKKRYNYFSIIPFVLATFFDIFSTFLLLMLQGMYFYHYQKKQRKISITIISTTVLLLLINIFFLGQQFILGPFHNQQIIADLIADLGGLSGMSFFLLFLAIIGLVVAKKQKTNNGLYLLAAIIIPAYIYSTQVIFPLTIIATIFATIGLLRLFEKKWILDTLRKFTLLLLILSILFSTFTYIDRITLNGPSAEEKGALQWISENIISQTVIFSTPENGYYIQYFTERPAFTLFHNKDKINNVDNKAILDATYVDELFPLLEKNKIEIIYVTSQMKEQLPQDYGLLFLLKNENFKLVYSQGETEVWVFKKE